MSQEKESDKILEFKSSLADFKQQIKATPEPVCCSFLANWCSPCRRLSGLIPQLDTEFSSIKFIRIDVDENPEVAEYYGITGIPTVKIFRGVDENGDPLEIDEVQGFDNAKIREKLSKVAQ